MFRVHPDVLLTRYQMLDIVLMAVCERAVEVTIFKYHSETSRMKGNGHSIADLNHFTCIVPKSRCVVCICAEACSLM
jgi:hypothetical protein